MTQQVEVTAKLTFEASADIPESFLKLFLEHFINEGLERENTKAPDLIKNNEIQYIKTEIVQIKEEAEIYGNI